MSESNEQAEEKVEVEETKSKDEEQQPKEVESEKVEPEEITPEEEPVNAKEIDEVKGQELQENTFEKDESEEPEQEKDSSEQDPLRDQEHMQEIETIQNQEPELEKDEEPEEEQESALGDDSRDPLPLVNNTEKGIEDEEMPSMVSISSVSRMDESDFNKLNNESKSVDVGKSDPQPNAKDDSDSDIVCLSSSDDEEPPEEEDDGEEEEDEEEEIHDRRRRYRHDDEDGEEEYSTDEYGSSYEESEDLDREHEDIDKRERRTARTDLEEYDEEDEDEDQDEYMDEQSCDGVQSDDVVLRHSNGLTKEHKERSASLQDLSALEGSSPKNKQNVNPYSQKAVLQRNQMGRGAGNKYDHVPSKVKQYIESIKEQRRMSVEKLRKAQEDAKQNQDQTETVNRKSEGISATCKTIKDYTERALREVAESEENENNSYDVSVGVGNGELSIYPRNSTGNENSQEMEVDPIDIESSKNDDRADKKNGTALTENQNEYVPERKGIFRREEHVTKTVLNGEDPSNPIYGVRTLTYEEYMKGSADNVIREELINNVEVIEDFNGASMQKCDNSENDPTCDLRIESIVSYGTTERSEDDFHNRKTPVNILNDTVEEYYPANPEVESLKMQLSEKCAQFEHLRQAYQKALSGNLSMKMEIENLRKMVSCFQGQQKLNTEKKEFAVQTEVASSNRDMPLIDNDEITTPGDRKLPTHSIVSAISSQWSDSTAGSGTISMDPPNVTAAINSDESTNQTKLPPHKKNALSRAFMTSTKILQTLASITHGKVKVDKPVKPKIVEKVPWIKSSNSRKRKATDTMEISSSAQPFKIPHISKGFENKSPKVSDEPDPVEVDLEVEGSNEKIGANEEESEDKELVQETEEGEDGDVKVYVFPDDSEGGIENSFLIQAKEVGESNKPGVRECGPYLLGNVEVYMTEMNGTINIWGKELSQIGSQGSASQNMESTSQNIESVSQNIEELDASTRSKDLKPGAFRWQSTPRIFNEGSASTSKKSRVMPRFTDQQHNKRQSYDNKTNECASCSPHSHRLAWPPCAQSIHENQHTCCPPVIKIEDSCCKYERISACCGKPQRFVDVRAFSMPNVHQEHSPCCYNHSHCRNRVHEESHRHQSVVRRHSFNPTDEENDSAEEDVTRTLTSSCQAKPENSSHSCSKNKLSPSAAQQPRKSTGGHSSDGGSSCENESDPLISRKEADISEGRKRRSSKGRVRGLLMDLLKGCGDCKSPIDKTNLNYNASVYEPKRIACSPSLPSCSPRSKDKCVTCNAGKKNEAAKMEAQLQHFLAQMEQLQSQSNALQEMMNRLREKGETNN